MGPVLRDLRPTRSAAAVAALAGLTAVLAACGEPPAEPLTEAPLGTAPAPSFSPAPPAVASFPVSTNAPTLPGANTLPGGNPLPMQPYTPPTTTTTVTTLPTPTVSPAAACTSGPSDAQVLAAVKGTPGFPDKEFEVVDGPYCQSSWHFSVVRIAGSDDAETLFVVTKGKPAALTLVEAGSDVCSSEVRSGAPAGIRVRACGE